MHDVHAKSLEMNNSEINHAPCHAPGVVRVTKKIFCSHIMHC